MDRKGWAVIVATLALAAAGCAKNYVITTDLADRLEPQSCVRIAEIRDQLPADFDPAKKPSAEDMEKFRRDLAEQLSQREKLHLSPLLDSGSCPYELRASLMDYKKGSGAARYFIGFGAGTAKVTAELRLVRAGTDSTVFAGNFVGTVSGGLQKGDAMFQQVSRDFAKQLEKQIAKFPAP